MLTAIAFASSDRPESQVAAAVRRLSVDERAALMSSYVGDRQNRRHKPGRAFERTMYRFEIVGDYGAFRDLQRHRMLTVEWQPLAPHLGFDVPEAVDEAGGTASFREAMERSADLYETLQGDHPIEAGYAVSLAYRIRYVMQMNAREAMHLIELRSAPQGHPAYRRVAQEMHRQIAEVAGHRLIADAMRYADHETYELERLEAERAAERRRLASS